MLNFAILASGSSGNCSVLWNEKAAVLIDCGVSAKYIEQTLSFLGLKSKDLSAAVITHAHIDHISASGLNFLIKNNIPLYSCEDVLSDIFEKYPDKAENCNARKRNDGFKIEDINVESFSLYHRDSKISATLGFTFSSEVAGRKYKIGYVTDTGKVCKNIIKSLADSNILVIESNYDEEMLSSSFRPYENKKWVLSEFGHLSNAACAQAIAEIKISSRAKDSLKYVFLAHLSKHHNYPELALKVAKDCLSAQKISGVNVFSAKRNVKSRTIKIA
ncbi:MBL fold metallo-hydrolase [Endomicrobium proavitum]|uniref:Metallo-beta-lactamase superfamily 1 protein n=1 Tax=Endomicrobium proavitum TaxID=1408281 RepID=A0A0G3WHV6_9BACT|nr:MBL fold metallo-hydrolase [Endomicrobium proavitum]AKL97450.1 Metallo-beta-lactamase superfamily 1 protein [Endomicrobium proavitum]